MLDFKPLNDIRCELGEGPVYDDRRNALWYCDILGRSIHCCELAGGDTRSWTLPSEVGSLGLADSGKLVVALRDEVGMFDPEDGTFERIASIEADLPDTRLNDGKVGPDGAFWVGTMDDGDVPVRRPIGALYRIDAAGYVERKVEGLHVSNGLAFSPDGATMFHADSRGPWVDCWDFDPDTGAIANRRRFVDLDDTIGRPDGGATDAEGCYWSAGISAGKLNRFSPDGRLLVSYDVPVVAPTMPCFGGEGLDRLFLTSLRTGRDPAKLEALPLTGTVIVADSPVVGSPVSRFRDA
ncbi:MAG: SMP-30/gluconolactonase/LRE family protein [Bauldia sp.]|uniref:SMP-30/gluconolactonase/LRE family protein n=1 Tax=Bauldia sp. TaxID=2575872 RepID=UPI001DC17F5D|nr:SMP-30/gluconolactonase/LRE family protein [Bauldia sp.]MCB1497599.1 SMP-30/gluconolactonase/LRE family protein [Bauldia sp.]